MPLLNNIQMSRLSRSVPERRDSILTRFIFQVNVDNVEEAAQEVGVRSIPLFVFFKHGSEVYRVEGASEQKIRDGIAQHA